MRVPAALAGMALLAACQTATPDSYSAARPEDRALAQQACAGCHSIEAFGVSPNADAPEWPAIANRAGLTRATLSRWLTEAHNYPGEMNFVIDDVAVEQLVDYMLTLRREDYHPAYQ